MLFLVQSLLVPVERYEFTMHTVGVSSLRPTPEEHE